LFVQFDGLGLIAGFLPDDPVVGLLAHDLASMAHGRDCRVAISSLAPATPKQCDDDHMGTRSALPVFPAIILS
jgi:hypothetical protein